MDKVVNYINTNDIDTIVNQLSDKGVDQFPSIKNYLENSILEYDYKVKEVIKKISQMLERYYVGQLLMALEDIPDSKIKKGQRVVVTEVVDDIISLNAMTKIKNKDMKKLFQKIEDKEEDEQEI